MKFTRYGSLKIQSHDIKNKDSFHTPPVKNGIYAFPYGYVEQFLLGGIGGGSVENGRYRFLRTRDGKKYFGKFADVFESVDTGRKDDFDRPIVKYSVKSELKDKFLKLTNKEIQRIRAFHNNTVCMENNAYDYSDESDADEFPILDSHFVIENEPITFEYSGNVWCHMQQYVKRCEYLREVRSWILIDIRTFKKALNAMTKSQQFYQYRWVNVSGNPHSYPISRFSKDEFEVFIEKL